MPDAAGSVNIVLSVNKANFSAAMADAQRQLDAFAGKSKAAGHSTVSSMQAASASIRLLENPLGNNIRAIERLISQSQILSGVMKAAFPLVGGIAMGMMVGKLIEDVVKFVKAANEMPKAITQGFASLNLVSKTSIDQLQLTNDLLQNNINKMENKPQNNQKIAIDEARLAMDKFSESIEAGNNKLEELLRKNHLSAWHELMFTAGTADREGTAKYFAEQSNKNAYDLANAAPGSSAEASAKKALQDTQNAQLDEARKDLQKQIYMGDAKDTRGPQAIDRGVITNILNEQKRQAAQTQNGSLEAQNKAAEANHAAALKAAELRKKAAEEFGRMLAVDGEIAQKWKEYEDNNVKIFNEDNLEKFKTNGLSGDDSKSLSESGKASLARITSLRESITLTKENADAIANASLQMAVQTGQMTRLNAAQVLANMHTQDYKQALQDLKTQRAAITNDPQYKNNEEARQAALQDNTNRINGLNGARGIQVGQDNQLTNPAASSGFVGAADALNEFVIASRDAAKQMGNFTASALNGFNDVLVNIMSTRSTGLQNRQALGNYGAGLARSVAGMGLQHAEGSVLGALGFGGKPDGSQGKPLYVRIAGAVAGLPGVAGGLLGKIGSTATGVSKSGGFTGFLGGLLNSFIPHAASGGFINGPTLIGEDGPELFSGTGQVTPNHKLISSGSTGHIINIDATGSTDPAQTRVQVMRGIQAAAPHIAASTISSQNQDRRRTPPSQRKS